MHMTDSQQKESSLKALTSQAVTLAVELSQALDKENNDSQRSIGQIRNLAVLSLNNISRMVVLLLEGKDA